MTRNLLFGAIFLCCVATLAGRGGWPVAIGALVLLGIALATDTPTPPPPAHGD